MQGIYTYIPDTNYLPREYSVAAILLLLFMVLNYYYYYYYYYYYWGTRWCSWFRQCATSRKVAGSIPDGVIETFH